MAKLTRDRLGNYHGVPTASNTRGLGFNQISNLVKAIPSSKTFDGKSYKRHTSSFSVISQNIEAKRFKKGGIKVRMVTYRRAGRNVYTLYTKSR